MSPSNHTHTAPRLLRLQDVIAKVGLGRASLYKRIQDGTFPKQIKLGTGAHAVAWNSNQVDEWIAEQIAAASIAETEHERNAAVHPPSLPIVAARTNAMPKRAATRRGVQS